MENKEFKKALKLSSEGEEFNNISPIFTYKLNQGAKIMWMGDIEEEFLDSIQDDVEWNKIDILFAPHHGRKSGHICKNILEQLAPHIIVLGEGPSEYLDYYSDFPTIKQNTAKGITFEWCENKNHIFVENSEYNYPIQIAYIDNTHGTFSGKYIGTIKTY